METHKPPRQRETEDRRPEGVVSEVEGFNQRARGAVRDEELQEAVNNFQDKAVAARNAVLNALPEAPELRERAYHIKRRTMANLDHYLEQMADAVEARGGKVFFASDGEGGSVFHRRRHEVDALLDSPDKSLEPSGSHAPPPEGSGMETQRGGSGMEDSACGFRNSRLRA